MKTSTIVVFLAGLVAVMAAPAPGPVPEALPAPDGVDPKDIVMPPSIYDKAFQEAIVNGHNRLRKGHCAQRLRWDDDIARAALADINGCPEHAEHMRAGSNLMGMDPIPEKWVETAFNCSWQWYEEAKKYNFEHSGYQDGTGHFTQVVWRDTQRIGCAFAACLNVPNMRGRLFCYYEPQGNIVNPGAFEQNVWRSNSCNPDDNSFGRH
jgi:hypothetical protein